MSEEKKDGVIGNDIVEENSNVTEEQEVISSSESAEQEINNVDKEKKNS